LAQDISKDETLFENRQTEQAEEKRVEFNFPLLILRTKRFGYIFDRLGQTHGAKYLGWFFLALVPFVAATALFLITSSLIALINNPAVGQVVQDLGIGSVLLLPGINPLLPIVYGWLAIVAAVVIHEGAHGVIARNNGFTVKSSGLLFFLIIPIGAFVDVDEEQIKKAKAKPSMKVMAAGVGGNVLVGVVCLLGLLLIVGSLSPIVSGVYVSSLIDDTPAVDAGLQPRDVLVSIDNIAINSSSDLRNVMKAYKAGDNVTVTVRRGDGWQDKYTTNLTLTTIDNRTAMGIMVFNLQSQQVLDNYKQFSLETFSRYLIPPTLASSFIPYSDMLAQFYTSPIGPSWAIIANLLFWVWFVNFNVAIFNALPIYPLDGGRIIDIVLKRVAGKKLSEQTIYRITIAVSVVCVILVLASIALPFII